MLLVVRRFLGLLRRVTGRIATGFTRQLQLDLFLFTALDLDVLGRAADATLLGDDGKLADGDVLERELAVVVGGSAGDGDRLVGLFLLALGRLLAFGGVGLGLVALGFGLGLAPGGLAFAFLHRMEDANIHAGGGLAIGRWDRPAHGAGLFLFLRLLGRSGNGDERNDQPQGEQRRRPFHHAEH